MVLAWHELGVDQQSDKKCVLSGHIAGKQQNYADELHGYGVKFRMLSEEGEGSGRR